MAEVTELSSPEFMKLLTDALRNGPGSPDWHQAVLLLGKSGGEADEYRLIIEAREHLESGKGYRQIRAGPGFTRKIMEGIERSGADDGRSRRWSPANFIAVLAVLVVLGITAWVIHGIWSRPAETEEQMAQLERVSWVEASGRSSFDGPLEPSWRKIGSLALITNKGLKPGAGPGLGENEYRGGGIVTAAAIPAEEPLSMHLDLNILRPGLDEVIAQVFVTTGNQFTDEKATSDRELVVQIKTGGASVALPDGRVAAQVPKVVENPREPLSLRIVMNQTVCGVEVGGKRLWAGEHQLGASSPRYVGVRFLRKGKGAADVIVVKEIRLLKAAK